ncbi:bifunctional phosphoribosylaminoimidazolecarboxamide formyltransferase/inosine monophosphate cyclohydrolase [Marinicauda salina]|uniref:Bifunctional purine biosynthesis protein PurH n=1 Tax=Marinicauda salina TaxID=2135793 RepID=A0A2U2BW00_9PROT|nr:bifunctional phosphoribosylaminoimidazolecarboxamide formyltransferase/IMP cyclohydrolase [Marinicauda salina]PWE18159.1 bifunctional phosphoribosylaminoimidazolecarboxamide formyltransferase/inosine monophosphate cyclohydrolase [Marinicauda salina]
MAENDLVSVRRALISVSDKAGLSDRVRRLAAAGVEIISTGGTLSALRDAGVEARDVADVTEYPEMMDGRVKTLHPRIHGGLLARRDNDEDVAAMEAHGIPAIDLLYVNLYPFEAAVEAGADLDGCIAKIDVGGPAMIRAAAKNHAHVAVCVDARDLDKALEEMEANDGKVPLRLRRHLAAKAFARTAAYDTAIAARLVEEDDKPARSWFTTGGPRLQKLRYGENPHQDAALYAAPEQRPGAAHARQVQGKELSFNNLADADAAFELAAEFDAGETAAAVIVKHANPCGVASDGSLAKAYEKAFAGDPISAFGGIVALNRAIDAHTADAITKIFTEVVIAPDAEDAALEILSGKKNLRVLLTGAMPDPMQAGWTVKSIAGAVLAQERDAGRIAASDLKVVTERAPDEREMADLLFAWRVAKHAKSNAIVYAKDGATAGLGMGQPSRLEAARLAVRKAEEAARENGWDAPRTEGSVCASDAFFPFADGLKAAAEAGATAVIQPGGSVRDEEVIAAANEAGMAMVFTGMRHFRH